MQRVLRISPLDDDAFAKCINRDKQYTATAKLSLLPERLGWWFDSCFLSLPGYLYVIVDGGWPRMCFSQTSCRPSVGSIKRLAKEFFHDGTSWNPVRGWPSSIPIRAVAPQGPPEQGLAELLGADALVHSIKYAMAEALKEGCDPQGWLNALCSMRVTFFYRPDAFDAEREKWFLEQQSQSLADERVLQGFNQVLAIQSIHKMLSTPSRPASAADVAAFFSKGRIKHLPEKTVKILLKIHARFTPECVAFWLHKFPIDDRYTAP